MIQVLRPALPIASRVGRGSPSLADVDAETEVDALAAIQAAEIGRRLRFPDAFERARRAAHLDGFSLPAGVRIRENEVLIVVHEPVLATGSIPGRHRVSRGDLVIVMQPSEDPASFDSSSGYALPREGRGAECGRAALLDSLVRSRTVEVRAVLSKNALQMVLAGEKDVVQAFPAQRADETLDVGGGLGCEDWRPHNSDPSARATSSKVAVNLPSLSRSRNLGVLPKAVRSRICWAVQAAVGASVDAAWTSCRVSRWMTTKT